jgi:hypothetical protein
MNFYLLLLIYSLLKISFILNMALKGLNLREQSEEDRADSK